MAKKDEPRVVAATGTAGGGGAPGLAKAIEDAMGQAAVKAQAEGITDPDEIRKRMLEAREAAKRQAAKPPAEG